LIDPVSNSARYPGAIQSKIRILNTTMSMVALETCKARNPYYMTQVSDITFKNGKAIYQLLNSTTPTHTYVLTNIAKYKLAKKGNGAVTARAENKVNMVVMAATATVATVAAMAVVTAATAAAAVGGGEGEHRETSEGTPTAWRALLRYL
jgi:hypothetical protein